MRKMIAVDQLRLGMHVHGFCGAWIDHPFWRAKFTLNDPDELAAALASAVKHCWIDTSLGLDVAAPAAASAQSAPVPPVPARPSGARAGERGRAPREPFHRDPAPRKRPQWITPPASC